LPVCAVALPIAIHDISDAAASCLRTCFMIVSLSMN